MKNLSWMVPGALAEYAPVGPADPWYPCVIRSEPWALGHGALVAQIGGPVSEAYRKLTGRETYPAGGILVDFLRPRGMEHK